MISTIKLARGRIDIFPNPNGTVTLYTGHDNEPRYLTPAEVGVLIVSLEAAAKKAETTPYPLAG